PDVVGKIAPTSSSSTRCRLTWKCRWRSLGRRKNLTRLAPRVRRIADNHEALFLTVAEAAKLLQISPYSAYELIRQGRIPFVRLGRVIRIPRFGLEQWIAREAGLPEPVLSVVPSRPVH